MLTLDKLNRIMPNAGPRAGVFLPYLATAMAEFSINTPLRQAMFLAQVAHESGELRWMHELASGAEYDTGQHAEDLGNTPEADGDGEKFKGRGPIQITGHDNYRKCSIALYNDLRLLDHPELLEQPEDGCRAAAWFWYMHGLNFFADMRDLVRCTKRINGGINGLPSREAHYQRALEVLT